MTHQLSQGLLLMAYGMTGIFTIMAMFMLVIKLLNIFFREKPQS
ncbi:MAG: OadG-related small transporter subunit [Thermodesulfobacteriota bacterium]